MAHKKDYVTFKCNRLFFTFVFSVAVAFCFVSDTSKAAKRVVKPGKASTKTLRSMARVYMAYGKYAKAQPLAEKALTLARKEGASDSEVAMCLIDLAVLYNSQGKPIDAEQMCESGLRLQEKVLYKEHPYLAYTMRTLSSIYYEQAEYHKAKSTLDKAITIMLASHSVDDKAMAPFFVDIAKTLVAQGDFEQAENYYDKAMVLINASYGPEHLYTANVLGSIAKLYTMQDRYDEAEKLINRAVAIQERIYGPDHHLIAPYWLTKAKVYQVKGAYSQAEKLIKKALVAVGKTGNAVAMARLEENIEKIRVSRQVAYVPTGSTN